MKRWLNDSLTDNLKSKDASASKMRSERIPQFSSPAKILWSVGYFDWLAKIGNCVWVQAEFETNLKLGTKVTIRSVHQLLQPITRVSDVVIEEVLSDINSILAASQRPCDATIATSPKQKSCANTRQKPP